MQSKRSKVIDKGKHVFNKIVKKCSRRAFSWRNICFYFEKNESFCEIDHFAKKTKIKAFSNFEQIIIYPKSTFQFNVQFPKKFSIFIGFFEMTSK